MSPTPCPCHSSYLEHLVLQFDFLVLFFLWVQMDVVQVPGEGEGKGGEPPDFTVFTLRSSHSQEPKAQGVYTIAPNTQIA